MNLLDIQLTSSHKEIKLTLVFQWGSLQSLPRSLQFVIHSQKICFCSHTNTGVLGIYSGLCHYHCFLTEVKKIKIKENCWLFRENKQPTVREFANVICLTVLVSLLYNLAPFTTNIYSMINLR